MVAIYNMQAEPSLNRPFIWRSSNRQARHSLSSCVIVGFGPTIQEHKARLQRVAWIPASSTGMTR